MTLDTTKVVTLADLAAGWEIIGVSRAGQHICWVTDPEELLPTLSGLIERGNQIASVMPVAALRRLDALSSLPAQAVDAPTLKKHLADHWLTGITCDHDAKTDTAACSCSMWRDEPHPSVGAAVEAWIEHVFATLPVAPSQPAVVGVTDEMVEAALTAWYGGPWSSDEPNEIAGMKADMRAALTAALVHRDQVKL